MVWSIGYDEHWKRWIGYGVRAYCDHPECITVIDRGLAHVCGGEPYGGEDGCGLYFCSVHMGFGPTSAGVGDEHCNQCDRCLEHGDPFTPKPEHPDWIQHMLTDESWEQWRNEHPEEVIKLTGAAP